MDSASVARDAQLEAFGREIDEIHRRVASRVGEADARYIRGVVKLQRAAEAAGRALLFVGVLPPAWGAGVALLSLSKILDNMAIGHNVLHAQYDFMHNPVLHSADFSASRRDALPGRCPRALRPQSRGPESQRGGEARRASRLNGPPPRQAMKRNKKL